MFGIYAHSFLTATRSDAVRDPREMRPGPCPGTDAALRRIEAKTEVRDD
ncbi:hypothetical protein [Tropicibacter naphthalenivorans]|uniref:Uncharacterized protein n=1 Tax=Tropicibacter naphthalenivorans TaxID=441103 RepID=A0A0P1G930_9RHOB|nr:hypothetical protein [Tropicibacter naphthalenivorans]CUH77911.1 hypothetical protein TRN7648_01684 [Tropicibacter naphthalenivorans]SMC95184.1 hypothetical protein SAMN04488093_107158 [Tropicibacter naphthalenivorans]